jgi:hypothetical protein
MAWYLVKLKDNFNLERGRFSVYESLRQLQAAGVMSPARSKV